MEEGCFLSIYDPKVSGEQIDSDLKDYKNNWEKSENLYKASKDSDAIIVLTGWDEFNELDYPRLINDMRSPSWIFDTRNSINVKLAESFGFNVWKLGDGSF